MNKKSPSPRLTCLLDTNIVEYAMNKDVGPSLIPYLETLVKKGAELVISEISVYELIKGADPSKQGKVFKTIKDYKRLETTKEVLLFAALFEKMYEQQKDLKVAKRKFDDIDRIIAATCFHENAYLMTGDSNDFPGPFFKEFAWKEIDYRKRNKPVTTYVCILQPDIETIKSGLKKVR